MIRGVHTFLALLAALVCCCCYTTTTCAKEIEPLADAWTLIGENDTIPAGMHVRIDMTTGEKWVKQMVDDDEADSGSVALQVSGENSNDNDAAQIQLQQTTTHQEPAYDYDRMYETLAQLPPQEHERMGGLPELPTKKSDNPQLTAAERMRFEARMKEIWEQRQAELRKIQQEQIVDLPEILKTQIRFMRNYVNGEGERPADQIKKDLTELEFLLADVDMARDFYTLEGWPWLLTLLLPSNETTTATLGIQATAAWVIGTAVQNTGEFHAWVVEPVLLPNGTVTTALDALTHVWNDQIVTLATEPMLAQKVLYALSACLRGNPLAQHVFDSQGQPARLVQTLQDTAADTAHGRKLILRILQLGHDLLTEWSHVLDDETQDAASLAVVQGFRQAWTTPAWCQVVLDKSRVVTRADKRLPLVDAWYASCQATWDPRRVKELLVVDDEDEDADTKMLHKALLQKVAIAAEG